MEQYDHVQIEKEDHVSQYRFPKSGNFKKPERDRIVHGKALDRGIEQSIKEIETARTVSQIASDQLLVIECNTAYFNQDIQKYLKKFNLSIVEETEIKSVVPANQKNYRILLQFATKSDCIKFKYENLAWLNNNPNTQILTANQRKELFSAINLIRKVSAADRTGPRLTAFNRKKLHFPPRFIVDIDLWYDGVTSKRHELEKQLHTILGDTGTMYGDLLPLNGLLLGRAEINEFTLIALLNADIVACVDFPLDSIEPTEPVLASLKQIHPIINNELPESPPVAAVIDSGIFKGNPLLSSIVIAEQDFDKTEQSTNDEAGHGTAVAGLVAYGDLSQAPSNNVYKPLVALVNAKVLHRSNEGACFNYLVRTETIITEAVEFCVRHGCRIINFSIGDPSHIYQGGRQFSLAATLDQLAKQYDVIFIISAGNNQYPDFPLLNPSLPQLGNSDHRIAIKLACRDNLFLPSNHIIDPATSALGVTVGSITRNSEPTNAASHNTLSLSVGDKDAVSVFSRCGPGIGNAVKPEFVDYGGNFAYSKLFGTSDHWIKHDINLMEVSLANTHRDIFTGECGTSLAAPHVTHIAARIEHALKFQLGTKYPSANLIRSLLAISACYSKHTQAYLNTSLSYAGHTYKKLTQTNYRHIVGYGRPNDTALFSTSQRIILFAEDCLEAGKFHIYKIPLPAEFLAAKCNRRIAIALAYNPDICISRKDYISNRMWFTATKNISEDTLLNYCDKASKEEIHDNFERFKIKELNSKSFNHSTLQQRQYILTSKHRATQTFKHEFPYFYISIICKENFNNEIVTHPQDYALSVSLSIDTSSNINLYDLVKSKVRIKQLTSRVQL